MITINIHYYKINEHCYYDLKDICNAFGLKYSSIKQNLLNNYISIRQSTSNKYTILIDENEILSLSIAINNDKFKIFSNLISHNALTEDMYDVKNHSIVLNM